MTNPPLQPAEPRGRGCFAKACLTFVGLFVLLAVAFIGGGFWAFRHLQNTYSTTEPLTFGNVASDGAVTPEASADDNDDVTSDAPLPPNAQPQGVDAPQSVESVRSRWRAFEKGAKRNQPARVDLTADEINTLIAANRKLRGKAFVTVANNSGRVKVSIPLDQVYMMKGRYFNGEATVEPAADGDPRHARISNVVFANQSVPDSMLDTRLFGMSSIRGYMTDWLDDNNIAFFTIENGHVVAATQGATTR
ncbi:MAG: hypothetical protein ABR526_11470 [Chthoniobacterales bacterium]